MSLKPSGGTALGMTDRGRIADGGDHEVCHCQCHFVLPWDARGNGEGWQIAGLRANFLAPKSGAGPLSRFSIPNLFSARRSNVRALL